MIMATKKSAGYQIDFTAKTLTITKECFRQRTRP